MTTHPKIERLSFETVEFDPVSPGALKIRGTITFAHPVKKLGPYLKGVHEAILAAGLPEYHVDISGLTFVNSSAIRLFVDWVTWVNAAGNAYTLVLTMDRARIWQRTALLALQSLSGDHLRVLQKE